MNSLSIRQEINVYLDQLSPDYLKIAKEILGYLSEKESNEATEELLNIPHFIEQFERGKKQIQAGEVITLQQLKRKY
jgi:hypothetical protein